MPLCSPFASLQRLIAVCLCCAVFVIVVPARHATAQGTSGMLPDPISSTEFDRYAALLNLSAQQRQAIDPMHTQYLEQFADFRANEVGDFLEDARALRRSLFDPDGGAAIKKTTRDFKRLMSRISSLDEQLFNQMQSVLSDDQLAELPRVRLARERHRYNTDATRFAVAMNPAIRLDLSELIADLELSATDVESIDVSLRRYESQLTDGLRLLHSASSSMFERVSTNVRKTVGEIDRSDPEQMRTMFRAFREQWELAYVEVLEQATKISTFNRTTFENLSLLLSADGRRSLQRNFYRRAYETGFRETGAADRRFNAALDLKDLTDDTITAINELREGFESRWSTIARQVMDVIDEQRAQDEGLMSRFGRDDEEDNHSREKLETLRQRLSALEEETISQLNALLGEEMAAVLAAKGAHEKLATHTEGEFMVMLSGDVSGTHGAISVAGTVIVSESVGAGEPSDYYIPGPIMQNDLDFYLDTLNVDEQIQPIIESIFTEYRESYQQISEQYIKPLAEAEHESWNFVGDDDSDETEKAEPMSVDQTFHLRREAMTEIQAIDETFFDDVEILLDDSDETEARLRRVRQSRLRDIYNRGESGSGMMFVGRGGSGRFRLGVGGQEERVDLTRALRDVSFGSDHQSAVEHVFNTYSDTMTEALRDQYASSLVFAEAMQQAVAEMVAAERAAADSTDDGQPRRMRFGGGRMREINESLGAKRSETTQRVINLNRQTVDELRTLLPSTISRQVRDLYYEAAYPTVYSDRNSARRQIESALKLPNLTGSQRGEILDIAAEYNGKYDELNLEMVRVQIEQPKSDPSENSRRGRNWQRMQELRNEIDRLRFSRDELNEKTRRRLRVLLNERQIDQVRGLADEHEDQ